MRCEDDCLQKDSFTNKYRCCVNVSERDGLFWYYVLRHMFTSQAVKTCVDRLALVIICMPRQRDGAHAHLTVNLYIYILTPSAVAFSWMRVWVFWGRFKAQPWPTVRRSRTACLWPRPPFWICRLPASQRWAALGYFFISVPKQPFCFTNMNVLLIFEDSGLLFFLSFSLQK